jgi:hypothetical protein
VPSSEKKLRRSESRSGYTIKTVYTIRAGPRNTTTWRGNLRRLAEVPLTTSVFVDVAVTY